MKFLLDTNIVIPLEPTSQTDIEPTTIPATELLRLLAAYSHDIFVHPASVDELRRDRDATRRGMREILLIETNRLSMQAIG